MTLTDALDEMVTNGELTPSIAIKVLSEFDKVGLRHHLFSLSLILPRQLLNLLLNFTQCIDEALQDVKTKTTFKVREVREASSGHSAMTAHVPLSAAPRPTQGNLDTYRFCDNVWTFILDDVTFSITGQGGFKDTVVVDKLKIVACDGRRPWVLGMLDSLPKNEVANEDMLGIIHRGLDRYWKKVLDVHLKCPPTRASCQSPLASHPFPNAREAPGSSTVGHPCALPQHLHQPRNSFPQTLPSPRTGRQHKHLPVARTH